ncbi:hypothetical protein HN51_017249 [Arachis hypogaea]|uniref:HpcH/HpaI aldolase/citrate lyase domain-containing protein n=1 Tax=Arachis hypogaea TaxID=3818 RepID=A0A445CWG2_ARAHY|nr:uncharacterized protein LOC107605409 [Arachis ipaensis]XP_025659850.1 uncharacterized protein LOC112755768 [Arachis hypogaea]QHN88933.1 2-keto-3-deoxy-L-rhamnonate aldolase [Arachis hypogaea]RYR55283.1 hypothetical protein Ahy_A06g030520 [Arachis hypogaea]
MDTAKKNTSATLKSRIQNGDVVYGMSLLTFSPTVAEIAALADFDFVLIDMEHGHGGLPEALPCLHALAAAKTPAVVRVPDSSSSFWARKAIDLGAQGIVFPMIQDPQSAAKAVSFCRSPVSPAARASRFGLDGHCQKDLLIICQVESPEAVECAEEIAAVEGVDMIMVGPLDLSAGIGCLRNPKDERVMEMVDRVEKKVLGAARKEGGGPFLGRFGTALDSPEAFRDRGYRLVRVNLDVTLFRNACIQDVINFKSTKLC